MHKQSTMHHTIALVSIIIVYGLYAYAAFCQKFNLCDRSLAKDTPSELKISKLHYNYPTCYLYYNFRSSAGFYAKIENYTAERRKIFCFCYFYLLCCICIVAACQTFTAWFYSCVRWQLHAWHEPAQRRLSERAHFARPDAV